MNELCDLTKRQFCKSDNAYDIEYRKCIHMTLHFSFKIKKLQFIAQKRFYQIFSSNLLFQAFDN